MTGITTMPTTEVRVVTLAVTGAPDLPLGHSNRSIIPDTVEITYKWEAPDIRRSWYRPGNSEVKVTGHYRLKSGAVSDGTASREFWVPTETRPDWLTTVVDAHQPQGWAEDTYTGFPLSAAPATEDGAR